MLTYTGQIKAMRNYLNSLKEIDKNFLITATDDECIQWLKKKGYGFFVEKIDDCTMEYENIFIFNRSDAKVIFKR